MSYAVEIGSGAMTYIPSFINTGFKICYGGQTHGNTDTQTSK
jgi:hypothetical protein